MEKFYVFSNTDIISYSMSENQDIVIFFKHFSLDLVQNSPSSPVLSEAKEEARRSH